MKTKILTSLILFAVLITSCNKPVYQNRELTDVDKSMIPYELGQTVSFVGAEGQPLVLTVTEDTIRFVADRQMDNLYYKYSSRSVSLQSENLRIFLSVNSYNSYKSREGYNFINVSVNTNTETTWVYYAIYYDKEGNFLEQGGNFIYGSKEINGNVYYDVVECKTDKGVNGQSVVPTQFFYNKTYGILQINRDGENFFTLQ